MFHKLYAFLLVIGLAFQTTAASAAPTPMPNAKDGELSAELKQNALELLSAVARESGQFKSAGNRVRVQTIIADLMWKHDEREARKLYQSAFADLQRLIAEINAETEKATIPQERTKYNFKRDYLAELRKGFVLSLAQRDPQAALAALEALKAVKIEDYDQLDPTQLKLQLASVIAKNSPERSYELAKELLAAKGVSYSLIESLKDLHKKDSRLAARLGKEVHAEIKNAKIRTPSARGESAKAAEQARQKEIEFWEVSSLIKTATELNRLAARGKEKKTQPLLTESEIKELVDLLAREFLLERDPAPYTLGQILPELAHYAPAQLQRIRLKIGEKAALDLDKAMEASVYHDTASEKSADELAEDAAAAPPELRDLRYLNAVRRALDEKDPEKAQAIAARIKDRKAYEYLFEQLDAVMPVFKAKRGDAATVRKMLSSLRTNEERIAALTELASALATKGELETAKKLLEESLQMMPTVVKKHTELESAGKVAVAYSFVAPEQSFTLVENGIVQMNDVISAAFALGEFYDFGLTESDELLYDAFNRQALYVTQSSTVLFKNLARADFARTVALADQFQRPEIRLMVRLRIAESLLDSEAAEKEKIARDRLEIHDDEH